MTDKARTQSIHEPSDHQSSESSTGRAVTQEAIVGALDGDIARVRKPPFYYFGLVLVTVAMVILPLIYLALVALAGYGVYFHATENATVLAGGGGRGRLIAYFGPLIIGGIVVLFMIKPLFARPPKGPAPFSLDPERQPLLFRYMDRLSRLLGSPSPKRIDVDCNVNASASFRRGWLSMFTSDLALTIGLPLVEGMTLRQLTGILAHELGHFAQGGGMRLSYVIRSVNFWFARVVYEKDRFDVHLVEASEAGGPWAWQLIIILARLCVWLTRRILWVLMMIGHAISCFLLRQMEYDADRYEARLAGSEEFEKAAYRLRMLSVGQQISNTDMGRLWEESKLPIRYPELICANTDIIEEEMRERIWTDALSQQTGWLDTHPSDSDRIRSARNEEAPGLMQIEAPSSALFDGYSDLSQSVTEGFYRDMLGVEPDAVSLVPTSTLIDERKRLVDSYSALGRFFQGQLDPGQPVFLSVGRINPPADIDSTAAAVKSARDDIRRFSEANEKPQPKLLSDRLHGALQLLLSPAVADQLSDANIDKGTIDKSVEFLHGLEPAYPEVLSLHRRSESLMELLQEAEERQGEEQYREMVMNQVAHCWTSLRNLKESLRNVPYPYEHGQGERTCETFAIPQMPEKEDVLGIAQAASRCANSLIRLYMRAIGDLTVAAEHAEEELGLPPLPDPPGRENTEEGHA